MFSALSLLVPLLGSPELPLVGPAGLAADEPPVRLWINGDRRFEPGDAARVQVETRDDGFLLVLNYDTDGRVRVLYPLDPRDDGFVRGGRRYEVREARARESFTVGAQGAGFVYVALSPDPWDLRGWARGSNWDYERIAVRYDSEDPERDLTSLLEGVAGARGFDYDLLEYFVHDVEIVRYEHEYRGPRYLGPGIWAGDPWCDPYWSTGWFCSARPGVVISYGRYYRGDWWSVGYGPSWYWPYDSWYRYRPYSYGRGYYLTYHRPWVWTTPTYRPLNRPVIVGRSRDYTVGRLTPWTFASGDDRRVPSARPSAGLPDGYRSPATGTVRARPSNGERTATGGAAGRPVTERAQPPASSGRARPAAGSRPDQPDQVRPAGRRVEGGSAPAARPATSRPDTPPVRPRARGAAEQESRGSAGAQPSRAPAERSTARPAARPRGQATESRPAASVRRGVAASDSRPAPSASRAAPPSVSRSPAGGTSRPAASRPAASRPPTPRAAPRTAPSRPAAAAARPPQREAPARSRGNGGRARGN